MNIFHIIVSTFQPVYLACNDIRRKQCAQYGVPYLICFNGKKPADYVLREDERLLEEEGMNPYMFLKFKYALQEIFSKGYTPDYIIRTTSTLFINYKKLPWVLSYLPKERSCAGPWMHKDNDKVFCNGTCMILSQDVARRLAFDDNAAHPLVLNENDDVSISLLARDYAQLYDTNYFYWWLPNKKTTFEQSELIPMQQYVFLRINNEITRDVDVVLWDYFYRLFDVAGYLN